MDKNSKFCDQYCLCYIELYEAQHPPVQMDKNIKCYLNSKKKINNIAVNFKTKDEGDYNVSLLCT